MDVKLLRIITGEEVVAEVLNDRWNVDNQKWTGCTP